MLGLGLSLSMLNRGGGASFPEADMVAWFGAPINGAPWAGQIAKADADLALAAVRTADYAYLLHRADLMRVALDGSGGSPVVGGVAGQILNAGTVAGATLVAGSDGQRATVAAKGLESLGDVGSYATASNYGVTSNWSLVANLTMGAGAGAGTSVSTYFGLSSGTVSRNDLGMRGNAAQIGTVHRIGSGTSTTITRSVTFSPTANIHQAAADGSNLSMRWAGVDSTPAEITAGGSGSSALRLTWRRQKTLHTVFMWFAPPTAEALAAVRACKAIVSGATP